MNITILGSSSKQTGLRECVSLLVETNSRTILFDTGPGVVSSLCRANRKMTDIDSVILTHTHGDHILGFAYFIYNRVAEFKSMNTEGDKPLEILGDEKTLQFADYMLKSAYPGMNTPFNMSFINVNVDKKIIYEGDCTLTFYNAIHAVPTLSTIITDATCKVVYTSDTLPNDDLIGPAYGADMIIHEAMYTNSGFSKSRKSKHATALDAGTIASKAHCRQLVMVHVAQNLLGKESVLLNEAAQVYTGQISIPYDGTVYHI